MFPGDDQSTTVLPEPAGQASPEPVEPQAPEFVSRADFEAFTNTIAQQLRQFHEAQKQSLRDTTKDRIQQTIGPRLQEMDRIVQYLQPLLAEGTDPAQVKQQLGLHALLEYLGQPQSPANNGAEHPAGPAGTAIPPEPQAPPDWLIADANTILAENGLIGSEPEIQKLHAEGHWTGDAQGYYSYMRDLEAVAKRVKAARGAQLQPPPALPVPHQGTTEVPRQPAGAAAAVDIGSGQGVAGRSAETVTAELSELMRTDPRNMQKMKTLREELQTLLQREGMVQK